MTHTLEINQLNIRRGNRSVLAVDHLHVQERETLALIGPNGSGKSTLLLALAHLIKPSDGQIHFQGTDIWKINALTYRRRIGLVLQDPLLLTGSVYDNVATGLRFRGVSGKETEQRVNTWLDRLGVSALRDRPAHALSGGEAQRVSLARSFALNPDILMLDEPFSALDAPTRRRLIEDIHQLLKSTPITTLFVTHDMNEALMLGDRVAVLMNGKLVQTGSPHQVFSAPSTPEIAEFVGVETIIPGVVASTDQGLIKVKTQNATLDTVGQASVGSDVFVCLRPEDITLWLPENARITSARNSIPCRIERLLPEGPLVRVLLDGGYPMVALITRASADELGLTPGMLLNAGFKATAAHLIVR